MDMNIAEAINKKAEKVLNLMDHTPNGLVFDADTILADVMAEADYEVSGLAEEIITAYQKTTDKQTFTSLFLSLTGLDFDAYLNACIDKMDWGREENGDNKDDAEVVAQMLADSISLHGFEVIAVEGQSLICRKNGDYDTHFRITVEEEPA